MSEQLDLLRCPPPPTFPPGPILREALVEGKMRWTLRRAWGRGPAILWCGLNPSKANGATDDPTMLRVIGFSYRWGFGSLVMINIYPYITSSPEVLRGWLQRSPRAAGLISHNRMVAREEAGKVDVRVAAWGAGATATAEHEFMTAMSWDGLIEPPWKCLGLNDGGSPIHPLARGRHRVPDNATLIDYPSPEARYG